MMGRALWRGVASLGLKWSPFLPAFLYICRSGDPYFISQWDRASHYDLEPPLLTLALHWQMYWAMSECASLGGHSRNLRKRIISALAQSA
jgi:hypothetical protein